MIMKIPTRSGAYALCVRYHCMGIGADTEQWILFVKNQAEREKRHRAILRALRDSLVSPDGAHVATLLPHLTGLSGAIMVRTGVGRFPLYSALDSDFVTHLRAMTDETCRVFPFETIEAYYTLMNDFIATWPYFSCLATEFRSDRIAWSDILSVNEDTQKEILCLEVYVWPMLTVYHHGTQKLLLRSALPGRMP